MLRTPPKPPMQLSGTIEAADAIRAHFQELSDYQVPIRCYRADGAFISAGRFSFEADEGTLLRFHPAVIMVWALDCPVSFRYHHEDKAFVFTAVPLNAPGHILCAALPKSVTLINRRSDFRIPPAPEAPVLVRVSFPGHPVLRMNAADVSSSGFSFHIPLEKEFFGPGAEFSTEIRFPQNICIPCRAVVRNLSPFFGVTRVGCEFVGVAQGDRFRITSYCMRRQVEMHAAPDASDLRQKGKICVVDSTGSQQDYSALAQRFNVRVVSHLEALRYLYATVPDLIVLTMDSPGAKLIAKALGCGRGLRKWPVVLIGKNMSPSYAAGCIIISAPYKPSLLVRSVGELLHRAGLAAVVEREFYRSFLGNGKCVAVVDSMDRLKTARFGILEELEYTLRWINRPETVIPQLEAASPDLILMAADMGQDASEALCRLMEFNRTLREVPKIRLFSEGLPPSPPDIPGEVFLPEAFSEKELLQAVNRALYGNRYEKCSLHAKGLGDVLHKVS